MKWLRLLAAILLVVAVGLVLANEIYVVRATRRLETALAPAREALHPLSLTGFKLPAPPPQQNAALQLAQCEDDLKKLYPLLTSVLPADWPSPHSRVTAVQARRLKKPFDDHAPLLQAVHQAAKSQTSDQLLDYTLASEAFAAAALRGVENERMACRVLEIETEVLRYGDQWEQAASNIASMLLIAKHRESEPLLVNTVAATSMRQMAFRALQRLVAGSNVPPPVWSSVYGSLQRSDDPSIIQRALASERVFQLSAINETYHPRWFLLTRGEQLNEQAELAEVFQPYATAAASPAPGTFKLQITPVSPTVGLAAPALEKAFAAHCEDVARLRAMRILVSIAQQDDGTRRRVVFHNSLPTTAKEDAEVPQPIYLNDTWLDPFDGQPMRVKRTPAGWLVYSIGKNLKDDDGNFADNLDISLGPLVPQPQIPARGP